MSCCLTMRMSCAGTGWVPKGFWGRGKEVALVDNSDRMLSLFGGGAAWQRELCKAGASLSLPVCLTPAVGLWGKAARPSSARSVKLKHPAAPPNVVQVTVVVTALPDWQQVRVCGEGAGAVLAAVVSHERSLRTQFQRRFETEVGPGSNLCPLGTHLAKPGVSV